MIRWEITKVLDFTIDGVGRNIIIFGCRGISFACPTTHLEKQILEITLQSEESYD